MRDLLAQAADQVLALRHTSILLNAAMADMKAVQTIKRRKGLHHLKRERDKSLSPLPLQPTKGQAALRPKEFDRLCLDLVKLPQIRSILNSPVPVSPTAPTPALPFHMPIIHRSLCITDPKLKGNPIHLRSNHFSLGPRGLKVGACEFLNLPPDAKSGVDSSRGHFTGLLNLSSRPGVDGHPTFVLEFANSLISEETGRATYVMASQTDVTRAIWRLAVMWLCPRNQRISIHSQPASIHVTWSTEELSTVTKKDSGISLSPTADEGSNGTYGDGEDEAATSHVDWLSPSLLAPAPPSPPKSAARSPLLPSRITTPFEALIAHVRAQHSEYFALAPSSARNGQWQISHTSPSLYAQRADARRALGLTEGGKLEELGRKLSGNKEIEMGVRWGVKGAERRMKCVPMVRGKDIGMGKGGCWLCFLL